MQVPKAGRTEVRSREISSGCGVRAGVRSKRGSAASPDQQCQTPRPETQDRKMGDKKGTRPTGDKIPGISIRCHCRHWAHCLAA